jgi:hypothetical protein
MDKPVDTEYEKPEPQNGKTTFTLKCYPEDAEALKNAQKICGPGYVFGKKLHSLVDADGLNPPIKEFQEIVLLKTNFSQMLNDVMAQSNALLDGLGKNDRRMLMRNEEGYRELAEPRDAKELCKINQPRRLRRGL